MSLFDLITISILLFVSKSDGDTFDEVNYGVKYATECEVCKIVSKEFVTLLQESSKKHEVLETGYSVQARIFISSSILKLNDNNLQKEKKRTKYAKSELRLIDTMVWKFTIPIFVPK